MNILPIPLPEPVRRFCYAAARLQPNDACPWGVVQTDRRYPDLWDANNAAVLEPAPDLTLEAIRADLLPALDGARAPTEHIEFWETSVESPALRELRATSPERERKPDVVMVYEEGAPDPDSSVRIEEILWPDDSFLHWYRSTLNEFGMALSEDVLDQLVARVMEVFVPEGLRWFVAYEDGQRAGYTSLVSLDGVGYLDNVVTMPTFRRRGLASATVLRAVRELLDAGDETVFLLAEEGDPPQRLYERLGFRVRTRVESFTRPR